MKSLILCLIASIGLFITARAQEVQKFEIKGNTHYGTKAIPEEILGLYKYEKDLEPIVEVNKDGTGFFQFHGTTKYPVEFWIETDENGNLIKYENEENSNYRTFLILKYGSNGEPVQGVDIVGTYDRIRLSMSYSLGYAIILGERFRKL